MKVETVAVGSISPDPANVRTHSPRNIEAIKGSLRRFGQQKPIVVDSKGVVRAGNGTLDAARSLGWQEIAIVRSELPLSELTAYAIADNRTAELAEWDEESLSKALADETIGDVGFDEDEIAQLDMRVNPVEVEEDDVPDSAPKRVAAGDLWTLGEHRLLCGDSTNKDDVKRLMDAGKAECCITDPPYNVGLDYGNTTHDNKKDDDYLAWSRAWFSVARSLVNSCVVLTSGITNLPMWVADIERTHRIIAWVKENQCSRNYIGVTSGFNVWEPILVFGKSKKCVARDSFSIPISQQPEVGSHPCPKSIKAWTWLVENFSDESDVIFDPFLGSGTTIIAAEQLGRRCYGLEISPAYCDIIVERWERLTGKKAEEAGSTNKSRRSHGPRCNTASATATA